MKTVQKLKAGIGSIMTQLAMARGLDKAVIEAAMAHDAPRRRSRYPGPARPAGSKLARKAAEGWLTHRHTV